VRRVAIAAALVLSSAAAAADDVDHFALGTSALREGRYEEAIDQLEAYADRLPSHPDASFNRGLAYVMRVRNGDEKPGDLGRAAAAFEETLALRSDDRDARHALETVHAEVARRRARRGEDSVMARPSLDRVVVRLLSERAWGIGAVVASLLLAVALVLRRLKHASLHLAGTLLAPAAAIAVVVLVPLYLGARHLRLAYRPAVVVVREAHFTDADGKALGGEPIPEAARLEIGERNGPRLAACYGTREGWVASEMVRLLRTR
jgi:tetratricopeptide (TPR) repeat protein